MMFSRNLPIILLVPGLMTLAGCGGSGSEPAPTPTNNTLVNDEGTSVSVQDSASDSDAEANLQSAPDTEIQSDPETNTENDSGMDVADSPSPEDTPLPQNEDDSDAQISLADDTAACTPEPTSVVFETYNGIGADFTDGRYVPVPAAGFGWDGTQICELSDDNYDVDEIEILVPYVRNRPDVDGVTAVNEWSLATVASQLRYETKHNDIDNLLLSPIPDYRDGAGYSKWRVMHDGINLYVYVYVSSDDQNSAYADSLLPWHDDSVEIFIDGDNSKGSQYDGIDDFQFTLLARSNDWQAIQSGNSASDLGIYYRVSTKKKPALTAAGRIRQRWARWCLRSVMSLKVAVVFRHSPDNTDQP